MIKKTHYFNTCENCKVDFEVKNKSYADSNNKKKFKRYCSEKCLKEFRSKKKM